MGASTMTTSRQGRNPVPLHRKFCRTAVHVIILAHRKVTFGYKQKCMLTITQPTHTSLMSIQKLTPARYGEFLTDIKLNIIAIHMVAGYLQLWRGSSPGRVYMFSISRHML